MFICLRVDSTGQDGSGRARREGGEHSGLAESWTERSDNNKAHARPDEPRLDSGLCTCFRVLLLRRRDDVGLSPAIRRGPGLGQTVQQVGVGGRQHPECVVPIAAVDRFSLGWGALQGVCREVDALIFVSHTLSGERQTTDAGPARMVPTRVQLPAPC